MSAFSDYLVRTGEGSILIRESLEKFKTDLESLIYLYRTFDGNITQQILENYNMATSINWTAEVTKWIGEANGATDKAAVSAIVNKFSTLLHDNIKAEAETQKKLAEIAEKRRGNIFLSFEDFATQIHPEAQIVSNAIAILGLRGGAAVDETAHILEELDAMAKEEIVGWIKGRGLILLKTDKGAVTEAAKAEKKLNTAILESRPKRGRQGKGD